MFHATFISSSHNFTLHFHFRYSTRATFNRHFDTFSLWLHLSYSASGLCTWLETLLSLLKQSGKRLKVLCEHEATTASINIYYQLGVEVWPFLSSLPCFMVHYTCCLIELVVYGENIIVHVESIF